MAASVRPITVDFGAASLKAMQITAQEEDASIVAAAALDTPDELRDDPQARFAHQLEALGPLLRKGRFRGRRVVCALPASMTFTQHLQTPRIEGVPLAQAVAAELQTQLGCDPAKVVVRPLVVRETVTEQGKVEEALCFAVARDVVMQLIGACKKHRLDLVAAHCQHIALVRAFDHITKRASDADLNSLYVDIGAERTKVVVARCKDIVFARTINFGGASLDEAVAQARNCGRAEARARRLVGEGFASSPSPAARSAAQRACGDASSLQSDTAGLHPALRPPEPVATTLEERRRGEPAPGAEPVRPSDASPTLPTLEQALEPVVDELSMCLRHHSKLFPGGGIDRAIFVGGEALNRPLCQHIARALRLPGQIADPLAPLLGRRTAPAQGVDLSSAQPGWATVFGLSFCDAQR